MIIITKIIIIIIIIIYIESEQGLNSLYEFIYSCRDSINSTYPNSQDPAFANSLKLLKKMKKKIASGFYNKYK